MPSPLDLLLMPTPAVPLALTAGLLLRRAKWGKDRTHGIAHTIAVAKQRVYGHAHGPLGHRVPLPSIPATHVGASSSVISQANAIITSSTDWNAAERQIALAIGLLETGFGVDGSWLFDDGTPSYNWGGLVGTGTRGTLSHGDKDASGASTTYGFKAFNSMQEGFDAFKATWTRGDMSGVGHDIVHEESVDDPASRGDALGVATTMYAHGYYTGAGGTDQDRINAYANAIVGAAQTVANALGEPLAVQLSNPATGLAAALHISKKTLWVAWGVLATAAGALAWTISKR